MQGEGVFGYHLYALATDALAPLQRMYRSLAGHFTCAVNATLYPPQLRTARLEHAAQIPGAREGPGHASSAQSPGLAACAC